jgi:hypothetical protein
MTSSWRDRAATSRCAEPDRELNRQLRRADWRFLLPDLAPGRIVCLAAGPLRTAVAATFSGVVPVTDAAVGTCDVVVASDADLLTLQKAAALLRPGGCCYVEYHGVAVSPRRMRTRLAAAGLEDVRAYWPRPAVDDCQAWIPLEDLAALSAYLRREERAARSVRAYVGRRVRRALALAQARFGISGCVSAIGVKPSGDGACPGPAVLADPALAQALGNVSADRCQVTLETIGRRSSGKIVALLHRRAAHAPIAAVKMARTPVSEQGLIRESDILAALHRFADLPNGIPRLLFAARETGGLRVGETALSGTPIVIGSAAEYESVADTATRWLLQLASSTRTAPDVVHVSAHSAWRQFVNDYHPVLDDALRTAVAQHLATLPDLPGVCEHRDFSPWNVHVAHEDEGLVVFDWESAVLQGVPALDLIYFLSYLATELTGIPLSADSYRGAWDPATVAGRMNCQCLAAYASRIGIDPTAVPTLRLLTWLVHAASEYRRIVADSGGAPSPHALRIALFFTLVQHEAAHGTTRR